MQKCKKCGKNFNKEDFSKFKYKQAFIGHFTDEMGPFNELTICPEFISQKEKIEDNFSNKTEDDAKNSINLGKRAKASIPKNKQNELFIYRISFKELILN